MTSQGFAFHNRTINHKLNTIVFIVHQSHNRNSSRLNIQKLLHKFTWDDSLVDYLVGKAYSVTYGARNLRRTIQKDIEDVLAQRIVENRGREIKSIAMSAQDGAVTIAIGE